MKALRLAMIAVLSLTIAMSSCGADMVPTSDSASALGDARERENVERIFREAYFFGDSTTAHLAVRGGIERERVWSGQGSTMLYTDVLSASVFINGEMMTLWDAAAIYEPKLLIITIGASGGAGFLGEARFKQIYRSLIEKVSASSPKTKIIVQSIFPLSDKSKKYYKKLTKDAVRTANDWIEDICREMGVPYLDTHSLLTDKNGYLKPHFQNDEYLHLTSAAYDVILGNVRAYIAQNINDFTA